MTKETFLTSRLFDYLTSHFDYWMMDHLTNQIYTQFFNYGLLPPKKQICVNRLR